MSERYAPRPLGPNGPCRCAPLVVGERTYPRPVMWCARCWHFVSFEAWEFAAAIVAPDRFGSGRRRPRVNAKAPTSMDVPETDGRREVPAQERLDV